MTIHDKLPANAREIIQKKGFGAVLIKKKSYTKDIILKYDQGYTFLQYQCVVRPLLQKKYGIGIRFLELLLFLYPMNYFTATDYRDAVRSVSWTIKILLDYEWIKVMVEGENKGESLYVLTTKSKHIVQEYYQYMSGEKKVPEYVEMYFTNGKLDTKRSDLLKKFMESAPEIKNKILFS